MRVSMSEIGSVILIKAPLPAGLPQTRNVAAHRGLAQLRSRQAELPIEAVRAARQRAAVAQPNRIRVAWELLQTLLRLELVLVGRPRVANELFELSAFLGVTLDRGLTMAL